MPDTTQLDQHSKREKLAAGLYLVATPIGNLGDITLRALKVFQLADSIACEDTRTTRKLLTHHAIAPAGRLISYHEHSSEKDRRRILDICASGGAVALVSEAGAPLISDPGFGLVRACADAGIMVTTLPGPSAPLAALQLSGLPAQPFYFSGFLPTKASARRQEIGRLAAIPATLVLFEAPHRLAASLSDLAAGLGPRPAAIVREITKRFEEVRRGSLAELAADLAEQAVKGEIVLVVGPPAPIDETLDDAELERLLSQAMLQASLRDAVSQVAAASGTPRRRVYTLALGLSAKGAGSDDDT